MEIIFGFMLAMFMVLAFTAGISRACSWIFEIGLWASIFLLAFFLITIGIFVTFPFLITLLVSLGIATLVLQIIGGKNDD